jgi:uroporphyrinogen decarboxylase-like protein
MTGLERLYKCIALEDVDRPGLMPSYMDMFSVTQGELDLADIIDRPDHAAAAMRELWDRLGGYGDAAYFAGGMSVYRLAVNQLMYIKIPGKHLPRNVCWQPMETPNLTRDDYDVLINKGWNAFVLYLLPRIWDIPDDVIEKYGSIERYHTEQKDKALVQYKKDTQLWLEKGVEVFVGATVVTPQMAFSCGRSLTEYTLDLYEIPDKVEEALWAALPELIEAGIAGTKATGIPRVVIIIERGSAQLYPLNFFERFEWPMLRKMVEAFVENGITPLLHLDTDWTKNLPYFLDFPKGKVICSMDGTTDLFNMKTVLRDHICIMGDVPASLLVAGTVREVENYVRRLCEEVGDGGGFILGTGCSMPAGAQYENVKAMIDVCKSYGN